MTKTVKKLLGEKRNPYLRSKADQKFAGDFTTDTSINNDDATEHEPNFKATNVASVEREKEGHGWDTEDISSKDGTDLEDADFKGTEKRLKAYKKLTNISEQQYTFLQGSKLPASKQSKALKRIDNNSAKKADDAGARVDKEPWQKGNRSMHLNMMSDALKQRNGVVRDYLNKRKERTVKEEVLAELSKATLQSYVKKAKQSRSNHGKAADAFISGAEKEYARGNTKSAEKHLDRADHHNMKSIKRKIGINKAENRLAEEIEQLDEASKVELYGRYVSDIKTTMTEVGKLLSTLAKHNQEGWIDLYSIRETFNRVQILRDDISGSVEVAERDAENRKKWTKEEQKTVSLREGVELFNNLPRKRNV